MTVDTTRKNASEQDSLLKDKLLEMEGGGGGNDGDNDNAVDELDLSTVSRNGPPPHHAHNVSNAEVFSTLRVIDLLNDDSELVPLHEDPSPSAMNTTFWQDCSNMTPGSVPHSVMVGIIIGIVCGLLAFVYYTTLEWLLEFVWRTLPEEILVPYVNPAYHWIWIPIVGLLMALGVGLSVQYVGEPGDLSYTVQCVHDKAFIGMDHVLPMLIASQFSILGGGSLGPEAPLVAICASFSGWISRKMFGQTNMNVIRKHTLMGMACALAAFFGVPLGGSLFALEINNRFGIEYYEHTMEAIFSGTVCLCVFRGIAQLDISSIWFRSGADGMGDGLAPPMLDTCTVIDVLIGAAIGLLGATVAAIFSYFHQKIVMPSFRKVGILHNSTAVARALVGSLFMLIIGVFIPQTMFWGEAEFETLATMRPAKELPHVFPTYGLIGFEMDTFQKALIVGVAKMIAISFTVAAGFRGGFIFPFFAAGAAFGRALVFIFPTLPVPIATLCFAAGINVAITRTSLATTLILSTLAGEINANPPILAASIMSLFVTSYMPFIRSQVKRRDIGRYSSRVKTGPSGKTERNNQNRKENYGSTD